VSCQIAKADLAGQLRLVKAKERDMTHSADGEFENNPPFSSPCSAPPLEPVAGQPVGEGGYDASPEHGSGEGGSSLSNTVLQLPVSPSEPEQSFERQADESFRMAFGGSAGPSMDGFCSAASEAYENASHALRASAEELASGFTQFNSKLWEFGRVNAQSNLNFMRDFAGVRTPRDLLDVQTNYLRGQFTALTNQLRELQALTTEIAGKTAAPFKEQFSRVAQIGRIC
jgi:hypothetical protein